MRILILTVLFFGIFYFTRSTEVPETTTEVVNSVDSIELKNSAPERVAPERKERILTVSEPAPEVETATEEPVEEKPEVGRTITATSDTDPDNVEQVHWTDLEEGWNNELKQMLSRLEPVEGETIHKSYMQEQENYQAELDALMNEKQQKTSDEAIQEVEQLMTQLDQKHQEHLKEVLGAHYEAVRGHYEEYMESSSTEE